MTRIIFTIAFAAALAMGCESTDTMGGGGDGGSGGEGGMGGEGGSIGPLTWVSSDIMIVGEDECMFFLESESLTFEMTIEGSNLTIATQLGDSPDSILSASTDSYAPTDDEVSVFGSIDNSNFDPCIVQLDDAFQLGLDDPDVSIDQNDTLSVVWNHVEEELSTDECEGIWFNVLPCAGEATMTLTQQAAE
ncbi:MAG: hypothetical protein ACN4G0_14320 [Polyangiales bacterium]